MDWNDDAGVFRLSADLGVIQTVDYFTAVVDDPGDYGEIAAANALSDVYAMGGEPITAMNVVGFPADDLSLPILGRILRGGQLMCEQAGVVLVGGHTVKSPELFYGLSVLGRVHPDRIVSNAGARVGDALVLTKPIGTGVLTTALKKGTLEPGRLAAVTSLMKRLNRTASRLMLEWDAHGCTDVTGYGLLGHLREMTAASGVDAEVRLSDVPWIEGAHEHAAAGDKPGGLSANRQFLESSLKVEGRVDPVELELLHDPQTSGGLLIALPPENAQGFLAALHTEGETEAAVIGAFTAGAGRIVVRP